MKAQKNNHMKFRVDDELKKALKIYVSENETTIQSLIESYVRKVVNLPQE
ncbi:hypothetical protein LHV56_19095 [Peribacillus frigoritolerans]|nr:hypothetical protein [Peribacillus frigoritolerans]USK78940.1 hypothetical protein LHV56_19095 [Peribacillus frigoritolerans]